MFLNFAVILAFGAACAQEFSGNSTAGMSAGNAIEDMKFSASLGLVPVESTSASDHGLDMSSAASQDATDCMKSSYSFVVPRGYHSSGSVDTAVCTTLKHAKSSGIAGRDAYLFPCPTCSKSASTQVKELVDYINTNCASAWTGTIWLDIEGTQYWSGGTSNNKKFYESLVDACKSKSPKCGVYSSSSQWSAIFGSTSYSYGSSLPLWYAHYDGSASFSDFTKFGGWTSPHAKQYQGTCTVCSTGVDKNYAPNYGPTPSSGSCDNKGK